MKISFVTLMQNQTLKNEEKTNRKEKGSATKKEQGEEYVDFGARTNTSAPRPWLPNSSYHFSEKLKYLPLILKLVSNTISYLVACHSKPIESPGSATRIVLIRSKKRDSQSQSVDVKDMTS